MSQGNAVWGVTLGLSSETESRLCLLPPWKATNPLIAPRTGRRHTANVVSPCECRSNHCCSFSALCRPLRTLGEPSCITASKPLLRVSIVPVQQCSSAGWTSSSFLGETKYKSRRISNTAFPCLIYWLSTWAKRRYLPSPHGRTEPAVVH